MTIIPLFLIMKWLGWVDTHLAIIVPAALFSAFAVFLLRQFIRGIPKEMEEAAMIDGCSRWRTYWQIILPLLVPAMSALGIFLFLGSWNNFFVPLIFLNSPELFTVPLMLNQFRGQYTVDWTLLMAGTVIAVLPVLIVYIIRQRKIIEGITLTGLHRSISPNSSQRHPFATAPEPRPPALSARSRPPGGSRRRGRGPGSR